MGLLISSFPPSMPVMSVSGLVFLVLGCNESLKSSFVGDITPKFTGQGVLWVRTA